MPKFSVYAARDGDTYHGTVEADDQHQAESQARGDVADEFQLCDELKQAREEGDECAFEAELDGFDVFQIPEGAAVSGDLDLVLELAERFLSEGELADEGAEARAPYEAAIERLRAGYVPEPSVQPIDVVVTISGGVMQASFMSRPGVRLYVVDYDQDGVDESELVDMAEPDEPREMLANVYEDGISHDADWVKFVLAKAEELRAKEESNGNG